VTAGAAPPLLIATFNPGKARELATLVAAAGYATRTLADAGIREPYEESGATYEDNGGGKARHYARASGLITIADDSGIEVDALQGEPGVRSARYGGAGLDDVGRTRRLLEALAGVPDERRTARYVAVAVIARPDVASKSFRGVCEGRIARAPRGAGGFGYDPVFFYPPFGATFAEVEAGRKHAVSHRGLAFRALAAFLAADEGRRFLAGPPPASGGAAPGSGASGRVS
jgi:XTP/dITP diphosphohydrolase